MENAASTWSSIARCCAVTATRVSKRGSSRKHRITGASLIASGRVPKTNRTFKLLVTIGDAALGQIVRRKLQRDAIARQYADTIAAEFARQVRKHGAFLVQLYAEQAARKFFNNGAGYFNAVFF